MKWSELPQEYKDLEKEFDLTKVNFRDTDIIDDRFAFSWTPQGHDFWHACFIAESINELPKIKDRKQLQFEQVVDKLRSQLAAMEDTLKLMPIKGNVPSECQRTNIGNYLGGLDSCINGITLDDFTPNEYSADFKLSYS